MTFWQKWHCWKGNPCDVGSPNILTISSTLTPLDLPSSPLAFHFFWCPPNLLPPFQQPPLAWVYLLWWVSMGSSTYGWHPHQWVSWVCQWLFYESCKADSTSTMLVTPMGIWLGDVKLGHVRMHAWNCKWKWVKCEYTSLHMCILSLDGGRKMWWGGWK